MSTQSIVSVILGVISIATAIIASPWLVAKARLIRERDEARGWAERLERRLSTLAADTEAVSAIAGEVRALTSEVAALRRVQIVSSRYIASLIAHIRSRKPVAEMPSLPPEISDEVLAELRARDAAAQADVDVEVAATAALAAHAAVSVVSAQ
jgi:hypothetical protein